MQEGIDRTPARQFQFWMRVLKTPQDLLRAPSVSLPLVHDQFLDRFARSMRTAPRRVRLIHQARTSLLAVSIPPQPHRRPAHVITQRHFRQRVSLVERQQRHLFSNVHDRSLQNRHLERINPNISGKHQPELNPGNLVTGNRQHNHEVITLSRDDARRLMVAHLGLNRPLRSVREVLTRLRCIQLDPLDVIGTNADLVVMARVDGAKHGDVWKKLFPRYAFEHFFKVRCILPASFFPQYREQGHRAQVRWWRHEEREERVPPQLVQAVYDEIRAGGPVTARELTDHGTVTPIDWAGWKSTSKVTTMALEILWTRCDIVVAGRTANGSKLYDVPERTFGALEKPDEPFAEW